MVVHIVSPLSSAPFEAQKRASNPKNHAWVSASAGTGKTKVLTDRVLSLLVSGVSPDKILCLTFTKAAAQEMSERVMRTLSTWAILSNEDLQEQLKKLFSDEKYSPLLLQRAKKLFGRILDHPQGLTIQTLHSFCQSFLQRFPIEASVSPGFTAIDEKAQHQLLQQAQQQALLKNSSPEIKDALLFLSQHFSFMAFQEKLTDLILTSRRSDCRLPDAIELFLEKKLGQSVVQNPSGLLQDFLSQEFIKETLGRQWVPLHEGGAEDQKRFQALKTYFETPFKERQRSDFEALSAAFLTKEGDVRKRLISKKVSENNPGLSEALSQFALRCQKVQDGLNALHVAQISQAFLLLAKEIIKAYDALKAEQGMLDYDDLIDKTVQTLKDPELAPWILYKMDGGLDHILLDEAQDTNEAQWEVLEALSEEFFSGQGVRDQMPTLFVVGDVKQSIYSFQGANPSLFDRQRQFFRHKSYLSQTPWEDVSLSISFRSAPEILSAVDHIFEGPSHRGVRTLEETPLPHQAFREGAPGLVELWSLEEGDSQAQYQEDEDLPLPSSSQKLAEKIANTIKGWLEQKRWLPSKNRPICPSDILILVQRRGPFLRYLHRALKKENIPATGEDRLILQEQLCVQDLLALGRFLLMPEDDFSLASVLKSPLVGLEEKDLFDLSYSRPATLWQALIKAQERKPCFGKAHAFLSDLFSYVDRITPYELYSKVLFKEEKLKAFLERLGSQALDPLEEFLNSLQNYEQQKTPSLQGFLHFFSHQAFGLKRDFSASPHQEVRLMTVHGSKGLQAPIVFLPDTVREPRLQDSFLWGEEGPIWNPPKSFECESVKNLRAPLLKNLQEEYNRLLYVAMTRAEDELYIAGFQGYKGVSESCWYSCLKDVLTELGTPHEEGRYIFSKETQISSLVEISSLPEESIPEEQSFSFLPPWVFQKPLAKQIQKRVRPSGSVSDESRLSFLSHTPATNASHQGILFHKIMEQLPAVPALARKSFVRDSLLHQDLDHEGRKTIEAMLIKCLDSPSLQFLFSGKGYFEVPVSGMIDQALTSGQIDFLLKEGDEILVIDFKTNRHPPSHPQEIPDAYVRQLCTYKTLIAPLYPACKIIPQILWASTGELMSIKENIVESI